MGVVSVLGEDFVSVSEIVRLSVILSTFSSQLLNCKIYFFTLLFRFPKSKNALSSPISNADSYGNFRKSPSNFWAPFAPNGPDYFFASREMRIAGADANL